MAAKPGNASRGRKYYVDGNIIPLGYQQITGLSSVQSLTVPAGARVAVIQAESQSVRWRDDGTNPTATIGMRLVIGSELPYAGNLSAIKFIEESASAKLNISYYG